MVIEQKDIALWNDIPSVMKASEASATTGATPSASVESEKSLASPLPSRSDQRSCDALNSDVVTSDATPTSSSDNDNTGKSTNDAKPKELSPWGVLVALASSPRGCTAFALTFVFGMVIGALDPTCVPIMT